MDLNRLTRDADDLIRKVVSRYNQLYVPSGTVSQLELDLMLDDLRKLYDTFKTIGHINLTIKDKGIKPEVSVNTALPATSLAATSDNPAYTEKQFISSEPTPVSPQPQAEAELYTEKEPEYKAEPEPEVFLQKETKEDLIAAPTTEAIIENEVHTISNKAVEANPVPESLLGNNSVSSEKAPSMLADKFNTGSKSLSETMASSQAGLGSRLLFQPIADLNTGIGLNDKFSFISDLFGNDTTRYDEAIARINKAVNLDEANWILQKYHSADWEQKPESISRLKDFVKRRFI